MDLHGIDLNLLVAFDALICERNVTRAGVRIGRTQPAMSAALARLRLLLKDDLFVRSASGLQPTPRALELAAPLGEALASIQRTLAFTQAFEPSRAAVRFTLALSDHPAVVMLPALLARLAHKAPGVTLRIKSFSAREDALALLDAGEADAAVGVPGGSTPRIPTLPLFEERFVCVARKGHPLADKKLTLKRFLDCRHLLVSPEGDGVGHVDVKLAQLRRRRQVAVTLPQMYAAPAVVAGGDLLATLMEGVVRASGMARALAVLPLPPELDLEPVPFVLHWHRRNDAHPAQRWLRDQVALVCRELYGVSGGP
ncbi:LysR family transcriptional regulator [Duganella sp. BJB488]|uniref:LysR family transcriptional regulator n=1 Tax=unclassified Duganella TaxID=2636909 RepID=UPI000E34B942|nr:MULTISPECIES: LysR family transcriptional regulator [unclassified Duganella]RFP16840.1 LysR family transcriptional regulator [Duganella sp. BJB489]RFP20741.1 LysR family transcriptional regulator [Duganella sp. BJB488]RFP32202.1 LysR family transcriptional regulator [Duganella sp. BJB480]